MTCAGIGVAKLSRAYTWAEAGYRTTQPSDRFLLASCSKMFLAAAVQALCRDMARSTGVAIEFSDEMPSLSSEIDPELSLCLYRIVQEALNNIAKHARARHVEIILERRSDQVSLIVEDDGVGFDFAEMDGERRGFGLLGMQERAALVGATVQIESAPGEGTTIFVRTPTSPVAAPTLSPDGLGVAREHA